jgi:hypothetical protein
MQHTVQHGLTKDLAKKATVAAMASYKDKYGKYSPTTTWTGDYTATVAFSAKGITLGGKLEVRDSEVVMDMDVPFLLRPFRGRALEIIEREIKLWCDKAQRGEL